MTDKLQEALNNVGRLIAERDADIISDVQLDTPKRCQARQYSDQMICGPCSLSWDTNDPEPPKCNAC